MPAAPKERRLENMDLEQQAAKAATGFKNEGWKTWT